MVLVILVPSLAVSVGLVLLSVALMRYLRYLKRSHDAIHLTVSHGLAVVPAWACMGVAGACMGLHRPILVRNHPPSKTRRRTGSGATLRG